MKSSLYTHPYKLHLKRGCSKDAMYYLLGWLYKAVHRMLKKTSDILWQRD